MHDYVYTSVCNLFSHLTLTLDVSLTRGSDTAEATKRESDDTQSVRTCIHVVDS